MSGYKLLPRLCTTYQNHCEICWSLDYEFHPYHQLLSVKKTKCKIKKLFEIFRVPQHLLNAILTKMYYKAFTKFRRTNKQFSEYIEKNRDKLRIAIFHDRSIDFQEEGIEFDSVFFADKRYYKRTRMDRLRGRTRCSFHEQKKWNLNFDDFQSNDDIKKELFGCFKPVSIYLGKDVNELSNEDWESFCNNCNDFIQWSGLSNLKITLEFYDVSASRALQISPMVHAHTITLYCIRELPTAECFKETKVLFLTMDRNNVSFNINKPVAFPQIRQLFISNISCDDIEIILKNWIHENSLLEEVRCDGVREAIWRLFDELITDPYVELQSKKAKLRCCEQDVPNFAKFRKDKNAKIFLLQQKPTGRKAICCVKREFHERIAVHLIVV